MNRVRKTARPLLAVLAMLLCAVMLLGALPSMIFAGSLVAGTMDDTADVDWTNGGQENIPEGAMSLYRVYWHSGHNYEEGDCDAGVIFKTVYTLDSEAATAAGGAYRFSEDGFIGLSVSDFAAEYATTTIAPKPDTTDALDAWNKSLVGESIAYKKADSLPTGWSFSVQENGTVATITYTMQPDDTAAYEDMRTGTVNGVCLTGIFSPILVSEKLDGEVNEASLYTVSCESSSSKDNGQSWTAQPSASQKIQLLTDKKDVTVTKTITPLDLETWENLETYTAEDGTIWMEPGQFAWVTITITRPDGILPAGRLLVSDYVPAATGWTDNFVGLAGNSGWGADSDETWNALRDQQLGLSTSKDYLNVSGLDQTKNALHVNNGVFGAQFTGLPVGGTVQLSLLIQAPASVDDPGTEEVEHLRLFYSNANVINYWQADAVKYMGTENADGQVADWAADTDTFYGVRLDDSVYDRTEWLLETDEFTLGLKDEVPGAADLTLSGQKHLTGEGKTDADIADGQFSFSISAMTNTDLTGVEGFEEGSVSCEAGGAFAFGEMTFSKPGYYHFIIKEDRGSSIDVKYDTTAYLASVHVTLNEETNELEAVVTYTANGEPAEEISFTNAYGITPPSAMQLTLNGKVTLTEDGKDKKFSAGQFLFTVTPDASNDTAGYTGLATSIYADAAGNIFFGNVSFLKEGTYRFFITQKDLKATGYTYDTATYSLTVVVTRDAETNALSSTLTVIKDGKEAQQIVFANTYRTSTVPVVPSTPTPVTAAPLTFEKVVAGQPATAGAFTMVLVPSSGSKQEVTVTGSGRGAFQALTFTKEGVYVCTVSEKNTGLTGYAYDSTIYTVTYTVAERSGALEISSCVITAGGKTVDSMVFTNVYTAQTEPATDTDTPDTDKPVTDKPVTDKPVTDKPGTDTAPVPPVTGDQASLLVAVIVLCTAGAAGCVVAGTRKKHSK